MVGISLKIKKAWLSIATWTCSLERLVNCTCTHSHNSVLPCDCTPHTTISSSLLDNERCTKLVTNIYKCRSAGKNKSMPVAGGIHELECLAYYHQGARAKLTKTHAGDYVKLVNGPPLSF